MDSDSFTILGLWVLGLAVSHIKESNCKIMSPEHYLMTSLQYYCILGLAEKNCTAETKLCTKDAGCAGNKITETIARNRDWV